MKAAANPLQCLFIPARGFFFLSSPKPYWCSLKSRAVFFFLVFLKAQFPFHNSMLLSFSASVWFHLETAAEDKRLNKIVQSGSIILLSKHRNFLLTPDLITRLLGEGCLSFSRCHLCATLYRPSYRTSLFFLPPSPPHPCPSPSPPPTSSSCSGCVCRSPPRIPESFSSLTNLSF